jgi:hypothetical protein
VGEESSRREEREGKVWQGNERNGRTAFLASPPSSLHHHCYLSSVARASKRRGASQQQYQGEWGTEKKQTRSIFFLLNKYISVSLYVCVIYESAGVGVCELLLFCFFTCFECNCLFGFPCPLCSFVNLGRVLSGRCLGVFLGCLSICFLFQINSNPSTYIWEGLAIRNFEASSPFGLYLLGSVGLLLDLSPDRRNS